jgi:hypothetical protein
MRFWLSRRLFRSRVRLGISLGPEDFRRPGIVGAVVLEVIKFVIAIPLALVVLLDFWILYIK